MDPNAYLGIIIAIVGSSLMFIAIMVSLFLWLRTEGNADRRHFQQNQDAHAREMMKLEKSLEQLLRQRR